MPNPAQGESSLDSASLVAYQAQTPDALEAFPAHARPHLRRMAGPLSRRLAADLVDDVVQEVLVTLLLTSSPYDPTRAAVSTYVRPHLLQAVRTIGAAMTPPGQKTRPDPDGSVIDLDPEDLDEPTAQDDGPDQIEARTEVDLVLRRVRSFAASDPARALLAPALDLVYTLDATWTEAAAHVGISRDALRRLRLSFAAHTGI